MKLADADLCRCCEEPSQRLVATPVWPPFARTLKAMPHSVAGRRAIFGLFLFGFALSATVLSLSDAAPGMVRPLKGVGIAIGRVIERVLNINVERESVPVEFDQLGHAVLWGSGMLGIGFGLRKRVWLPVTAVVMVAISLGFEFLQGAYTSSRTLSIADGWGNIAGIATATVIVAIVAPIYDWWAVRSNRYAGTL